MSIVGATSTRVVHTQGHIDGLLQAVEKEEGLEYEQRRVDEMVVVQFVRFKVPRISASYECLASLRLDVELRAVATSQRGGRMEVNLATYEAFPF